MERPSRTALRIGDWTLRTETGELVQGDITVMLEARMLRLLLCLTERAGNVVSIDDLLAQAWQGVVVTPDSVYQAITALRRQLGDDPKQPRYIATVPRRGYKLIAEVAFVGNETAPGKTATRTEPPKVAAAPGQAARRPQRRAMLLTGLGLTIAAAIAIGAWTIAPRTAATPAPPAAAPMHPSQTVAVLPFLDLTDGMSEEPFADGMVEEVIGKLSKMPGLKVAPPAASFYYKEKQVAPAEVAHALHVAYLLDGSVRKSGRTLRVSARLARADDGFVVWSESYDRDWSDKLMVQNDIADKVAKALASTLR